MIRSHLFRYCFALLLLGLLGTSFYVYHNFTRLLNQRLGQLAQQYGVQDVKYEGLHLTSSALNVDQLWLQGTYQGYAYEATLQSIQMQYDWRLLSSRRVQSVALARLELAVEQYASTSDPGETVLDIESLHPQKIVAQLPVNTLHIKQMDLDYRALDLPPLATSGNLHIAGNLELQLTTTLAGSAIAVALRTSESLPDMDVEITQHDGDSDLASLSAQLQQTTPETWQWQLQGEWDDAAFLAWLQRLAAQTDLPFDRENLEQLVVVGNTRFSATIHHPKTHALLLTPGLSALENIDATLHLVQTVERLDYADSIEGLTGAIDATLILENGLVQLTAEPFRFSGNLATALLTLPQETQQWLRIKERISLNWSSSQSASITSGDGGIWNGRLQGNNIELADGDTRLNLEALELTASLITGGHLELNTNVSTRINTRLRKQQLPQLAAAFTQQGTFEQYTYALKLGDATESVRIIGQGTVDLTTGRGEHHFSAQIPDLPTFTQLVMPPLRHFSLLQSEVAFTSGSIQLDTNLQTTDFEPAHWTQVSQLELKDLSGNIGENHFQRLALSARWSGIDQWKTMQPIKVTLEKLESGFEVQDFTAQITLPKPTPIAQPALRIETVSARIFGGTLDLPKAVIWDFGAEGNALTLRARQWQLAELVALQQDENIYASGELEGELPVTMADGRVIIEKGYLRAMPPGGSIRYVANEASQSLGKSSKELTLALDLLSDFQYQTLSTEVELDKEGKLLLGLSLAGRNPARFEGRQINFNINLEQNIDPLLQSLRVSDTLVEKIENRLK